MSTPKCPLCGATSTWMSFPDQEHIRVNRNEYPDKCSRCKADEGRWERDSIVGPDMVDGYGSRMVHEDPFMR